MDESTITKYRELWKETTDTVKYAAVAQKNKSRIIWTDDLNSMIRHEVLELRFNSREVMHPARKWLEDVEKESAACAGEIRMLLYSLETKAGAGKDKYAAVGAAGVAGTAGVMLSIARHGLGWNFLPVAMAAVAGIACYKGAEYYKTDREKLADILQQDMDCCGDRIVELLKKQLKQAEE
jgi:hypothetical protein